MVRKSTKSSAAILALAVLLPGTLAQSCISLRGSEQCKAFGDASISTNTNLTGLFPFLSFVSSTETFDRQIAQYVNSSYVQSKYQTLLGCDKVDLTNTTSYYARYTTTVICNSIVQNSITPCGLSGNAVRPLCADACAQHAITEEEIVANKQLCGTPGQNFADQIRADFTNCALPTNALTGSCIHAVENEPGNCGFASSLDGLCRYCGTSSPNATDSCCYNSNATGVCIGVVLPTLSSMPNITFSPNSTAAATEAPSNGLSGGAIAGIVIGSIVAAILLAALIAFCCITARRRRRSTSDNLNQPSPRRLGANVAAPALHPAPGGRVARMTALEGSSGDEKPHHTYESHSEEDSPMSRNLAAAPVASRRRGSLSSNSMLGPLGDDSSPGNQVSSPEGVHSAQSEQLPFFKDYYSTDDIHPGDKVATLWAYQPRANDEFELERGDMLKVVGIWDDGWATGIRISGKAEDYDGKHKMQRDSGVSNGHRDTMSPEPHGDIKAFPLVCICLPEHWRKTIEGGDSSTETTSGAPLARDTHFPNF